MKVLVFHVPYEFRGGEDIHVDLLVEAYRKIGVEPILFPEDRKPPTGLMAKSLRSLAPSSSLPEVEEQWAKHKPNFIHGHNSFPIFGPRFFRWAIKKKVPVVMTVHNHRFFCTNGIALRGGKVCKDCSLSKVAWRPLLHNCNGNWTKTVYHSLALTEMRVSRLYSRAVKRFIAPSPYIRNEMIRVGYSPDQVHHILNPIISRDLPAEPFTGKPFDVFYAGRLSQEKGIRTLLEAASLVPELRFVIAGGGPEQSHVEKAARDLPNLEFIGSVSHEKVLNLADACKLAVLPSICNEILPTFVMEAYYRGKRCVIPNLESTSWLSEGISQGFFPGHLFEAGNGPDLARAIRHASTLDAVRPERHDTLRKRLSFDRFCNELLELTQTFR